MNYRKEYEKEADGFAPYYDEYLESLLAERDLELSGRLMNKEGKFDPILIPLWYLKTLEERDIEHNKSNEIIDTLRKQVAAAGKSAQLSEKTAAHYSDKYQNADAENMILEKQVAGLEGQIEAVVNQIDAHVTLLDTENNFEAVSYLNDVRTYLTRPPTKGETP